MSIQYGRSVVKGIQPLQPIVNLPPDVLKVRIKMRPQSLAMAFLKFNDRIEQHVIEPANRERTAWKVGWITGVNCVASELEEMHFTERELAIEFFNRLKNDTAFLYAEIAHVRDNYWIVKGKKYTA
jgi:hypothetical protein